MIAEFWVEWILVCSLMFAAVISPGPDFVMAVRHALIYSRKTGFYTALGFGLGVLIHVAYCIIGIAALIASSVTVFNIIKYIGAAFLVYMGIKALRSKGFETDQNIDSPRHRPDIGAFKAVQIGFLTNLLNPKATMFFLAMFTQIIDPATPMGAQMIYGASCFVIVTGWFTVVSFVLSTPAIKKKFLSFAKWIDRVCGGLMIALGIKLVLSKA